MSIPRREFIKTATLLSSGLALTAMGTQLVGCGSAKMATAVRNSYGLQLYTLRDVLPKDVKGVLTQVASFGYKEIEGYEGPLGLFWGMKNTEFKKLMDDLGMRFVSSHCKWEDNFDRKAAEAAEIGMSYLMCPYLGPHKEIDYFKKAADKFNASGEIAKKAGIRFAYHNHDYSFKTVEGVLPQDVMMQNTNADLVDYEMDIYWVVAAGADPIAWFKKYPNRFRLAHVKDRKGDESVVAGTGTIDFPKILKEGQNKGLKHFIIEQEAYTGTTSLAAAKDNATYMKNFKI